jgi:hypothetical protein
MEDGEEIQGIPGAVAMPASPPIILVSVFLTPFSPKFVYENI